MSAAVEAAARALAGLQQGESWPTNAELGGSLTGTRDDEYRFAMQEEAKDMLSAALPHLTEGLNEFIDGWYDRWAGPGESWTAEDLATAITEELKRRIEA